ncbi:hypothetical protein OG21DRAFT_1521977 [Imleria badia]|nr:hypothetical protein OG21DRAFT_1521977 [Imleria badia]
MSPPALGHDRQDTKLRLGARNPVHGLDDGVGGELGDFGHSDVDRGEDGREGGCGDEDALDERADAGRGGRFDHGELREWAWGGCDGLAVGRSAFPRAVVVPHGISVGLQAVLDSSVVPTANKIQVSHNTMVYRLIGNMKPFAAEAQRSAPTNRTNVVFTYARRDGDADKKALGGTEHAVTLSTRDVIGSRKDWDGVTPRPAARVTRHLRRDFSFPGCKSTTLYRARRKVNSKFPIVVRCELKF